ncbi:MAG TPA: hypothetical protein VNZ53_27530 [Steroidobacteraceae bacterium]|jgi:hypothetical protein|nr:hypothetical protein [Steroidobacteraceae bacterium]
MTDCETDAALRLLAAAVERLREIAALAGTTKRKQAGCELAASWLYAHGYPLVSGGYLSGVGFVDEDGIIQQEPKT